MTAIAALKGPFVGQRGAQYQIFKWPPDYLYIVLVLVGVEQSTKKLNIFGVSISLNVVIWWLIIISGQKWVLLSLKIIFLRFLSVKYVLNWPGSSLFRFYSVKELSFGTKTRSLSIWLILAIFRLFLTLFGAINSPNRL